MDRRGSRTEALERVSARHHDGDGPKRSIIFLLLERVFYLLAFAIQAGLAWSTLPSFSVSCQPWPCRLLL